MTQTQTVAFLSSGAAFDAGAAEPVEVVETHGAYVFLCGDTALKLKRAVRYDYMDLSTVELRHEMLQRELDLNAPAAPQIYRDVLPVTRGARGLQLGGSGPVVDWVLRMWRFPAEEEFEAIAARCAFDDALALQTGAAIARYHAAAPVRRVSGRRLIAEILAELDRVFAEFAQAPGAETLGTEALPEWQAAARAALAEQGDVLEARGAAGHVRRAHGDLHLRNLVRIDGQPVLFDALEFDETLGTCDVLYDVAFLVMDLCHRGLPRQACRVLDAWLREARGSEDAGLAALPLFLSVRAAIRAMVLLQTDAARRRIGESAAEVSSYLSLAVRALHPPAAVLLAVGGFSGSGKSVLARALAPGLGALPGAVLLSSDLERKQGRSAGRLGAENYALGRREAVYERMLERAAVLLAAGQSVVLDATFTDPALRRAAGAVAQEARAGFHGLWLEAPVPVLEARVAARHGDASDADVSVLRAQIARGAGDLDEEMGGDGGWPNYWHRLDASATPTETLAGARRVLGKRLSGKPGADG
ncbi:AAA family ATPase [Alloyangia pacifica]|uniref:bifunctional aminoglycoside phosphotransferase/ATP-binding protein n=1 Tax=Alloyangia pacifica TaxID=311180 RepID=UPI001CD79DBF|nr:AAA family ATPase [Alloyangia pacifica]MCA0995750.1 AAA family ATPase [Alloyangia pacifica]